VQPPALLLGWRAGQDLDDIDPKYKQSVWKLVGSRFTAYDIGRMITYTLSYLAGYAKNNRVLALVSGGIVKAEKDSAAILASFETDPNIFKSRL